MIHRTDAGLQPGPTGASSGIAFLDRWPPTPPDKPNRKDRIPESEFVSGGKVIFDDVLDPLIEKFKKENNLD